MGMNSVQALSSKRLPYRYAAGRRQFLQQFDHLGCPGDEPDARLCGPELAGAERGEGYAIGEAVDVFGEHRTRRGCADILQTP